MSERYKPLAQPSHARLSCRTLVIIFAPLTLVHVMVAIYVRHTSRQAFDVFAYTLLARVFQSTAGTMAYFREACPYSAGSMFHLRLVCSLVALL